MSEKLCLGSGFPKREKLVGSWVEGSGCLGCKVGTEW